MATWNREVALNGQNLVVSLSSANPNPPNHGNDTADSITLRGPDRAGAGAKIIYHAVRPNNNPGSDLSLTGLEPCPPTTAQQLAHLDVKQTGKNLQVTVGSAVPLGTYSYKVVGDFADCGPNGDCDGGTAATQDPKIHNDE